MPASTLDPVGLALRDAFSKNAPSHVLKSQISGSARRILCTKIDFDSLKTYQKSILTNLKSKYILLHANETTSTSVKTEMGAEDTLAPPPHVLYPIDSVQLGWNNTDWSVGAGMINMGNTCYLNSTLQALFHVPALVNWLLSDKQHMISCEDSGGGQSGCIICAMSKTLQATQQKNANAIRPWAVYSKLRVVCRHLVPGRQEDAHEFLRYLVEAMERAYIQRFRNLAPLDTRSKETTPLNQILGGYLRSAVRCLDCGHVSTTFQHFQDLLLDIRKVNALDDALELYFSREKLDEMAYHCENCKKKVLATKQFYLERAPMVLCIQLKRFSVTNNKITKHITFRQRLELTRYARRKPQVPLVYRLVSLVTHVGQTVSCGHYTAVAQAPTGNFYQFDDSMVRPISQQSVFSTNAYIMLYELECAPIPAQQKPSIPNSNKAYKPIQTTSPADLVTSPIKDTTTTSFLNSVTSTPYHQNGLTLPKNAIIAHGSSSASTASTQYNQNGNGRVNGAPTNDSSSDSDDSTTRPAITTTKNTPIRTNNNKQLSVPSSKSSSSTIKPVLTTNNTTLTPHVVNTAKLKDDTQATSSHKTTTTPTIPTKPVNGNASSDKKPLANNSNNTHPIPKLVPYDDDSSNCSEEPPTPVAAQTAKIVTKATAGSWQVSPTSNTFHGPSLEGQAGWNKRQREAVTELMHMSHAGYAAPVNTWNGTRAALDREINTERREDRKRTMADNHPDRPRVKQQKHNNNNNNSYMNNKSNPGYNPFQEHSRWHSDQQYYNNKPHYNGVRHRYQRRGNYHNNRHREKFRH